MRCILIVMLTGWLPATSVLAGEPHSSPCLMRPPAVAIHLQERGFTRLAGEASAGPCDDVASAEWSRKPAEPWDLYVHCEGPEGSGRFWNVTIGVSGKGKSGGPGRGVCVTTSTVGWRTLGHYSKGSLPWLDDVNADGRAELILWDSFPLHDKASMAEYALVGWVYGVASLDLLLIDWDLTRSLARSLAKEYRSPPGVPDPLIEELRTRAAEALERFAEERCSVAR